ncbi:GGDEF domain-containing protein [Paenibacillus sp. HN-1]|uniref:GGDEF domain-containing protein n=1 Tax=Paenibacillus TaxID=44249 RepID=UPI001CA8EC38|nr:MULTISPECIES: GGDEF domain-containing protein [Paenibacillus]MBY9079997.1 GGDEF domain-containing protein [Paenibacillus sp. CGMCC 1.18879]MBY9086695.1 GGDEF domain-containing protein [Paenibacillus sinensis]
MSMHIGEIAETIPVVTPETKCDEVYHLFKTHPNLEGLAIAGEDGRPSLIMRALFFQKIGTRYGYPVYMDRPVKLIMNAQPLVVDYMEQITEVSIQAMNRAEGELYDLVLITLEGSLFGAVSIRRLLLTVADVRAEMGIFMNPLTGLPGNRIIDEWLYQFIQLEQFSVLYIDLDYFKSYNDSYGFKKGDQLIQATAGLLRKYFAVTPKAFLGHIGGDDFIAILDHHDFKPVCEEAIADFEQMKRDFYTPEDLHNNHVFGEGRSGQNHLIPLVSMSIAVVSNRHQKYTSVDHIVTDATRIKKVCKSVPGSVCVADQEDVVIPAE